MSVLRLHNTHVTNIQEAANTLLNSTDMTPCRRSACKGIKSFELILRNLVSFEISEECISVYETPTKLVLKYNEYELISIIEFIPPTVGTTGHYKAHCRRGNIWQCYDDVSTKIMRSTNKKVIPHCIIYVRIYFIFYFIYIILFSLTNDLLNRINKIKKQIFIALSFIII